MERPLGLILALALFAGCRAPAPANDPFLYRSTIPPPGTLQPTPGAIPPTQPYYPGSGVAPAPMTSPPVINPGVPATTPGPLTPSPIPGGPISPDRFAPPGGFNQSSTAPGTPPTASNAAVSPAAWQAPAATPSNNLPPRPEPSVVRIVEPAPPASPSPVVAEGQPAKSLPKAADDHLAATASEPTAWPANATATMPSDAELMQPAAPAAASPSPLMGQGPGEGRSPPASNNVAQGPPRQAGPTDNTVVAAATAPSTPASSPEITDLAPVGSPRVTTQKVAPSGPSAANDSAAVNLPGDRPGVSYGNDADYTSLRGKLEYSVAMRRWKLRYLPADATPDQYGGAVVLPDPSKLAGFEAGDFVTVQGTLTAADSASGLAPLFAVSRIKRQ